MLTVVTCGGNRPRLFGVDLVKMKSAQCFFCVFCSACMQLYAIALLTYF